MQGSHFITIEGIEGAGKTTAVRSVKKFFLAHNVDILLTREPGGTEIAENIRKILLVHNSERMYPATELLLMFASRAQHLEQVIKPALQAGKTVVCDRFTDASYAYQGAGRGIEAEQIAHLENLVQGDLRPDLTLILDVTPEVGLTRANKCSSPDRIESEQLDFFRRVRLCYLQRARSNPERYVVINAMRGLVEVARDIEQALTRFV